MTFTLLSVFVIFVFATIACVEICAAVRRGFHLSMISLGAVILSLFLSFPVTQGVSSLLSQYVMSLVQDTEIYRAYAAKLPSLGDLLKNVLSMVIGTVLFIFIFWILRVSVRRIAFFIYKKRTERYAQPCGYDPAVPDRRSSTEGAICGLLSALILTNALVAPIMGTLLLADRVLTVVKSVDTDVYNAIGDVNASGVHDFTEDAVARAFYDNGGRTIYNSVSGAYVSGKRAYLLDELETVSSMSVDMLKVYDIFWKPQYATEEHAQALRRLSGKVGELTLCGSLAAETVRACSIAWKNGDDFLGMYPPKVKGVANATFKEILEACGNTNFSNVSENTATMLEAYAILLESGIFTVDPNAPEELLRVLQQGDSLARLEEVLGANPNMKNVRVSEIAVTALADRIENGGFGEEKVSRLHANIALILSDANASGDSAEQRASNAARLLCNMLRGEGISLDADFSLRVAKGLLLDLTGREVSASDVRLLFERRCLAMQS